MARHYYPFYGEPNGYRREMAIEPIPYHHEIGRNYIPYRNYDRPAFTPKENHRPLVEKGYRQFDKFGHRRHFEHAEDLKHDNVPEHPFYQPREALANRPKDYHPFGPHIEGKHHLKQKDVKEYQNAKEIDRKYEHKYDDIGQNNEYRYQRKKFDDIYGPMEDFHFPYHPKAGAHVRAHEELKDKLQHFDEKDANLGKGIAHKSLEVKGSKVNQELPIEEVKAKPSEVKESEQKVEEPRAPHDFHHRANPHKYHKQIGNYDGNRYGARPAHDLRKDIHYQHPADRHGMDRPQYQRRDIHYGMGGRHYKPAQKVKKDETNFDRDDNPDTDIFGLKEFDRKEQKFHRAYDRPDFHGAQRYMPFHFMPQPPRNFDERYYDPRINQMYGGGPHHEYPFRRYDKDPQREYR